MPRQTSTSIENNFSGGLKTEFTGLNFPENSCTDTDNCVFSLIGEVTRRPGFEFEENHFDNEINRASRALSSYLWKDAGGDGTSEILVQQIGAALHFYLVSSATSVIAISATKLISAVSLTSFLAVGNVDDYKAIECQYANGNGYLIVFHPSLDPFYCTYNASTISAFRITVNIRDFYGIPEPDVADTLRPSTLTDIHKYNLINQGWTAGTIWSLTSDTDLTTGTGAYVFNVASGIAGVAGGQAVVCFWGDNFGHSIVMSGTVTSYIGTNLTLNITSTNITGYAVDAANPFDYHLWSITPTNVSYVTSWFAAIGNYPSNADVWWRYKDASDVFAPATRINNVTANAGPAPKGYQILEAFNQTRSTVSGVPNITNVTTTVRPKTGTWFAGRVWYAGVDASFPTSGTAPFSSWSENLYFSQIVTGTKEFGKCHQTNDPTSEDLFDLLPSDGGVINIQGCGTVYKLFPMQNGLLVFAANGIWFITGSQGIGFTANDYTITKISGVKSISATSFVDVQGIPFFWNEEGIYTVGATQQGQGGLPVNNIALQSILSFYADIPTISKKYARGDYDPLSYEIHWIFRDTAETTTTNRYEYNRVLIFNTNKGSFYPWTIASSTTKINDVKYITTPNGAIVPRFKYLTTTPTSTSFNFTFSDVTNTDYEDFGVSFDSFFITGYKLHGNAIRKFQPEYVFMYSRADEPTAYKIQGIWEFAISGNSGKFSSMQLITNALSNFGMVYRKHRIRGHGLALQLKVESVEGMPFKLMGWTTWETSNASV